MAYREFPWQRAPTTKVRALAHYLARFLSKLYGNERNWTRRGVVPGAPLYPPMAVQNGWVRSTCFLICKIEEYYNPTKGNKCAKGSYLQNYGTRMQICKIDRMWPLTFFRSETSWSKQNTHHWLSIVFKANLISNVPAINCLLFQKRKFLKK